MAHFMSAISEAVDSVERFKQFHPGVLAEPNIKCGDVKRLWSEIERVVGRSVKDEEEARAISSMQFHGVPVIESSIIPANIVIIFMGDEVIDIVNLDRRPSPTQLPQEATVSEGEET